MRFSHESSIKEEVEAIQREKKEKERVLYVKPLIPYKKY
jgi:hypothetical protein